MTNEEIISLIRTVHGKPNEFIPLHAPVFSGNEKEYLIECIDSTFVSSVGPFVDKIEQAISNYVGSKYCIVTANGTAGLHLSLVLAGVDQNSEVITQPLTFVATANAISYCGAYPTFIDVDHDTMGLSPSKLNHFLSSETRFTGEDLINKHTGRKIKACVPMHTFGHPCRIDQIVEICNKFKLPVIEDAAESIGSYFGKKHTGTFGKMAVFSFNGNKTITAGGGGAIVTDDQKIAKKAKHLSTTAKVPHRWEYVHDAIGYNYRMPNLNAALLLAQLEQLDDFLMRKREIATQYADRFSNSDVSFISEPAGTISNYWLCAIKFNHPARRTSFLKASNDDQVMTRPLWKLMHRLNMFNNCYKSDLTNSESLEQYVVNIPSSVS